MNGINYQDRSTKTLAEQLEHELGAGQGTALFEEICFYLARLGETDDLNWIDLIVLRLTREGVAPLPVTIQGLAARAADRRLRGAGKRGGQPTKVLKEVAMRGSSGL